MVQRPAPKHGSFSSDAWDALQISVHAPAECQSKHRAAIVRAIVSVEGGDSTSNAVPPAERAESHALTEGDAEP
jgi:hypothetical protein